MRCHDGKHKSDEGLIIPNDCHTCHIILEQGNRRSDRDREYGDRPAIQTSRFHRQGVAIYGVL